MSFIYIAGAGYHLTIVKQPECNVANTTDLIQTHVPEAKLENNVGAELSYILPHERVPVFEALFTEMEDRKDELGISSYGASVTTMEEVFLRYCCPSLNYKDNYARVYAVKYDLSDRLLVKQKVVQCRMKALQKTPVGVFCITFILHLLATCLLFFHYS